MNREHLLIFIFFLKVHFLFAQKPIEQWKYTRAIRIDNRQSVETLQDYQINIPLNARRLIEQGKLHPKAQDLRVFDSDGQTELCYWIEGEIFENEIILWLRIPEILAQSRKTVYLAYGNKDAPLVDYQNCTFLYFDDFNGQVLDEEKWQRQGNGEIQIQESCITFKGEEADILLRSRQSFELPLITEMKVTQCKGKYLALALIKDAYPAAFWEGYTMGLDQNSSAMELVLNQSDTRPCGGYNFNPTRVNAKYSEEHEGIWSLSWIIRNAIFAHWPGGDFIEPNAVWQIGDLNIVLGVLACNMGQAMGGELSVDWIRVRKLAAQPPSTSTDSEQVNTKIGAIEYKLESFQ